MRKETPEPDTEEEGTETTEEGGEDAEPSA